jgi:hypothetical protein
LFSPLQVERIDAAAVIEKSSLVLRQGRAELYGGQLSGSLEARLAPEPSYAFDGQFARVDLRDAAASAALPGRVTGLASGDLKLTARGQDRAALAASLQGQGLLRAREAVLDLAASAESRPLALTARFQIADSRIRLDQLLLAGPGDQTEVTGTVDFARRLDLRVQSSQRTPATPVSDATPGDSWTIAGTLDAPRVTSAPITRALAPDNRAGVPAASASR